MAADETALCTLPGVINKILYLCATSGNTVYNSDNVGELQRVELVLDVVAVQVNNRLRHILPRSPVMSFKKDEESGGMCTCFR